MLFVANLRPQSIESFSARDTRPQAWLLSSHRLSRSTLRYALAVREQGQILFADNGTKIIIEETLDQFSKAAESLNQEVRKLRRALGRTPRGKQVPPALRKRASDLANQVLAVSEARSDAIDWEELLSLQLSMRPTHLIAQEDFGTACLIGLGLEREITGWPISAFVKRNRRSLQLWQRVVEHPDCRDVNVYAVLSAMDYNTARAAGELAARTGVTHVALGTASITLDRYSTDFYVKGYSSFRLNDPAPRRYVRFAQIALGIADGYRLANKRLEAFHALGLGAPTFFPLLAAATDGQTTLTVDATSPIHDAVRDRVMYNPVENGNRENLRQITSAIVRGKDWPFLCPFCQSFRQKYGHQPDMAQASWVAQGQPTITNELLQGGMPLADALPLFADLSPPVSRDAEHTHIAHNHWVVSKLAESVPDGPNRKKWAEAQIGQLLDYESLTTSRGLQAARSILFEY
ncbi:MAG: hypothetical protein L0332_03330 [Chloroflexi bacterium]|nr:hypothetical protein [Chloroflexota bacterium]MCI0579672.1 hypothetical protein [Chloroflexota bacterium]MCI0645888.1 hypothetical protein [Chloroflexota bacterium]MCI0725743.1 hypothetical protein [Chloroflexota bacterium]